MKELTPVLQIQQSFDKKDENKLGMCIFLRVTFKT